MLQGLTQEGETRGLYSRLLGMHSRKEEDKGRRREKSEKEKKEE